MIPHAPSGRLGDRVRHRRHTAARWLTAALLAAAPPAAAQRPAPRADSAATRPPPRVRTIVLPVIGYTPETRAVGGVALVRVVRPASGDSTDRPSTTSGTAIYSQRGQLTTSVGTERWTPGNRWRLAGGARYARFPFEFYGVGRDAPDAAEEHYTPRRYGADLDARRRVARALYLGGSYEFERSTIVRTEAGGLLDAGTLAGSEGGNVSLLGATTTWDTRDNLYWPTRGLLVQLAGGVADGALASDFDFGRLTFDARSYLRVGRAQVLALQGVATVVDGDVPFDRLSQLGGGSVLRGYLQGRYRDDAALAVQAEFRTPLWRRFGAVAFVGAGDVAPRFGDIRVRDLKTAAGGGLRFALSKEDRLNLRLDVAGGSGSSGTYVTVGEAF